MSQKTCSDCAHYRTTSGPKGACWWGPPVPVMMGMAKEGSIIGCARPPVPGNTPQCGQFKQRLIIQIEEPKEDPNGN